MTTYTVFEGHRRIASGGMPMMIAAQREANARGAILLIYDDATGRVLDVDPRADAPPPRRGRPSLGVKSREVTLLPRHWDWLARQRGGASAALRRLVEAAARADGQDPAAGRDAAYAFLSSIAGDLPGFEEMSRALFAGDMSGFAARIADWPEDIRAYALRLAGVAV